MVSIRMSLISHAINPSIQLIDLIAISASPSEWQHIFLGTVRELKLHCLSVQIWRAI